MNWKKGILLGAALAGLVLPRLAAGRIGETDRDGYPVIVPTVKKRTPAEGNFTLPQRLTVSLPSEFDIAPLRKVYGETVKKGEVAAAAGGEAAKCRFMLTSVGTPSSYEGYRLVIDPRGITVSSRGRVGLFYGMQSLNWILRNRVGDTLKCCTIDDWPDLAMRGLFWELNGIPPSEVDRLCKVIEVLGALKYNVILADFADNFPLSISGEFRRPLGTFSQSDIETLMAAAKRNHIEIIPYLQIASHTQWLTRHREWEMLTEGKPRILWCSAYCLSNPRAAEIVDKVVDEQCALLKPRFFHMGLDEISGGPVGKCPRCRGKDPAELLFAHVKPIQKRLLAKGITPIVYQDEFVRKNIFRQGRAFVKALDGMDRRVLVNSWEYDRHPAPGAFLDLTKRGFDVVYMSWHERVENTMNLPRMATRLGAKGSILAFWLSMRPTLDQPRTANFNALPAVIDQALYSWNSAAPAMAALPFDAHREMRRLLDPATIPAFSKPAAPLDLAGSFDLRIGSGNRRFPRFTAKVLAELKRDVAADPAKFRLETEGEFCKAAVLSGAADDGFPAAVPPIPVGSTAEGFSFLLAAAPYNSFQLPVTPAGMGEVAVFRVRYEDGREIAVPLHYRYDLSEWNSFYGGWNARSVVRFNDAAGALVTLTALDWRNPRPEVPVKEILFSTRRFRGVAPMLLAASAYGASPKPAAKPAADLKEPVESAAKFEPLTAFRLGKRGGEMIDFPIAGAFDGEPAVRFVDEPGRGKVLEAVIPPLKSGEVIGRLTVDVPIAPDAKFETFVMDAYCDHPEFIRRADIYIMGKPGCNHCMDYDRGYARGWNEVRMPRSAISGKEDGGAAPGTWRYIRIGFFVSNTEPMTFRLDNIGLSRQKMPGRFEIKVPAAPEE